MRLNCQAGKLSGLKIITPPTVFDDFRGDYIEIYNRDLYREAGIEDDFKQDDYATSRRHVLRGMHGDATTAKLVKCLFGSLYFVALQANPGHPDFMKWEAFSLNDRNRRQIYVPAGFAIGYLVLSDAAIFHYKQTSFYHETEQFTIKWNDERAGIWWPVSDTIRSMRDG